MQKIDYLEDHNLKSTYLNGKECGQINLKEVIQQNIKDKLSYEDRRKFRLRAFAHFASFDPLVVYYENGYALLERVDSKESFMDLVANLEDVANYFVKHGYSESVKEFVDNFAEKSKDAIRKII